MKIYDTAEELSQATTDALKQYQTLVGGGSAILLYLATAQTAAEKQQEVMQRIAEDIGVESQTSEVVPVQLREIAADLHKKVQECRADSPTVVVDVLEEGLGFLEKLCEKHM